MNNSILVDKQLGDQEQTPLITKIGIVIFVMAVVAGTLTAIMTWANLGFADTFLTSWGKSFVTAIVVMMPIAGLLMALFDVLVKRAFPRLAALSQNLIIGLAMSVAMQSIMALIAAANVVGFDNFELYRASWSNAFITAFPAGLILAVLLTTVIKPRLEVCLKAQQSTER